MVRVVPTAASAYIRPSGKKSGTAMVELGREEIHLWLGEPDDLVQAILRDIYASDAEVDRWLHEPQEELDGRTAAELLGSGRTLDVEAALIRQWNAPRGVK